MSNTEKTVIILAGPTASGKTILAIELAKHFQTEIISADSRQCYKELNIGVARPDENELASVRHYFIATHSIHQQVNASIFESYALQVTDQLFQDHDTIIMAGGTGLYLKAFCEGLDHIPEVSGSVRAEVLGEYNEKGITWLNNEMSRLDPNYMKSGEVLNPQRLMRALEVMRSTGQSILSFRTGIKKQRPFKIIKFVLEIPRQELYHRIDHRVDQMIERGLIDEARSLYPFQQLNALQTVGYKELFDYFNREISRADSIHLIKQNTRHYAKRQLTWFRKDKSYNSIPPSIAHILATLRS